MTESPLVFEGLRIEPNESRVWRRGRLVALSPRAFSLLCFFASHPRRLLAKDEILDAVWPGLHVTEGVLKTAVQKLREALGDDVSSPWLIATVPRKGYRFLPAPRTADLPSPLTSFVGREQELDTVAASVRRGGLVTLTGAGGSGKTRLALEVARTVVGDFVAGDFERVAWVELAAAREPELVPHLVAAELGVREHAGLDLTDALGAACRATRALVVLDNCEHLVAAAAELAAKLLAAAPAAAVLATSREPLAVAGEQVVALAPLAGPAAVRLFRDRARLVLPDFDPREPAELELVSRICRRLDGMPLALELAAARLRLLSLEQIAGRLDRALDFLASGERAAPERHRTLRATVDWSLRLLEPEERRLLDALGAFAGSFTLEAAEAVAASSELPRGDVLGHLDRLVAKSVVEVRRGLHGASRFFLLETIRQTLAEDPPAPSEDAALRDRHLAFYRELALAAGPHLMTGKRGEWIDRLAAERDNLRAALAWSRERPQNHASGLEIAGSVFWFWFFHGSWGEGRRQLRSQIDAWQGEVSRPLAEALFGLGFIEFASGHIDAAGEHLRASAERADEAGEPAVCGLAISFLSQIVLQIAASRGGDLAVALDHAERGTRMLDGSGGPAEVAMAHNNVGNVRRERGEPGAARAAYERGLSALREDWDDWLGAMLFRNLGILQASAGAFDEAAELYRRSLAHLRPRPEPWFLSRGLDELAAVEIRRGRAERAARLFGAAEALRARIGAPIVPVYRRRHEAAIAATGQALPGAFERAWEAGGRMSLDDVFEEAAGDQADTGSA